MADDQDQHKTTAEAGPAVVQGKSTGTAVTTVAGSTDRPLSSVGTAATSQAGLIGSPDDAQAFYPPGTEP